MQMTTHELPCLFLASCWVCNLFSPHVLVLFWEDMGLSVARFVGDLLSLTHTASWVTGRRCREENIIQALARLHS